MISSEFGDEIIDGQRIELLWNSFLNGNEKSFEKVYLYFVDKLFAYGTKFTEDLGLIQDTIQDVFLTLHQQGRKQQGSIHSLKAYIFVAFRNNLLRAIKKKKTMTTSSDDLAKDRSEFLIQYSIETSIIENDQSRETKNQLKNAIQKLTAKQSEIIFLRFEQDLDYSEIAATLNISIESCRKLFYRSINTLRAILKKQ